MLTRGGFCRVVMRRAAISAWGKLYPIYSHSHSHSHRHLPLPLPWQNLEILLPSFPQNNNNNRQRLLFHFPFVVLQCRNFLAFDFDTAASNGAQRCHLTNKERNSNNKDDEPKNDTDCLGNSKYIKGQSPCHFKRFDLALEGRSGSRLKSVLRSGSSSTKNPFIRSLSFYRSRKVIDNAKKEAVEDHSQSAVVTAMWCNFMVFSLKSGVWMMTSSHVMLAEVVHSAADLANQALLAYGLSSSRRAPDALHPYGYSKERFVWSLISAVGIFCLGCGATIVHGIQHLWDSDSPTNVSMAAVVIGGSFIMEGISLLVALRAVRKGAAAEGMKVRDYVWRGHDPTSVAVMMEDGAAVTGLLIAAASLVAVKVTGNPIYDPLGSILVGHLLGMVAIFLIQRNRQALIGRAIDPHDMARVLAFLSSDPVVEDVYDCKSEVIGPGSFRFKAEIEFNGVALVQNYLQRTGREAWAKEFREAVINNDDFGLDRVMANYGEEVISALGFEVDRLEKEIQSIVPGIQHVDIETHNPKGPLPEQTF